MVFRLHYPLRGRLFPSSKGVWFLPYKVGFGTVGISEQSMVAVLVKQIVNDRSCYRGSLRTQLHFVKKVQPFSATSKRVSS